MDPPGVVHRLDEKPGVVLLNYFYGRVAFELFDDFPLSEGVPRRSDNDGSLRIHGQRKQQNREVGEQLHRLSEEGFG